MSLRDEIWPSIRGIILEAFTFNKIKEVAGSAGLPISSLAHLQQRSSPERSSSKSELMDGIDGLLNGRPNSDRNIRIFIEEIIRRNQDLERQIDGNIRKFGWRLQNGQLRQESIHIDVEAPALKDEIQAALQNCTTRYSERDFDGAITAICGAVDHLTETVYSTRGLGNPHNHTYQQRVNRAFSSFETEFKCEFAGIVTVGRDEIGIIWNNYKGAINQSAYVLGSFRRSISDVHGPSYCPEQFVQKALDCGTFILRSFIPYI